VGTVLLCRQQPRGDGGGAATQLPFHFLRAGTNFKAQIKRWVTGDSETNGVMPDTLQTHASPNLRTEEDKKHPENDRNW